MTQEIWRDGEWSITAEPMDTATNCDYAEMTPALVLLHGRTLIARRKFIPSDQTAESALAWLFACVRKYEENLAMLCSATGSPAAPIATMPVSGLSIADRECVRLLRWWGQTTTAMREALGGNAPCG